MILDKLSCEDFSPKETCYDKTTRIRMTIEQKIIVIGFVLEILFIGGFIIRGVSQ